MQQYPVELNSVIYNATTQSFEALVTVHAPQGARKYACAIDAPITMTYSDAASCLPARSLMLCPDVPLCHPGLFLPIAPPHPGLAATGPFALSACQRKGART